MAIRILRQDKYLLVCEKPVGVLSEASETDAGNMPALLAACPGVGRQIYPVHRLDRGVGGLMVYAKDAKTASVLSALIAQRAMVKSYYCLVHGMPADAEGRLTDLLYKDARQGKSFVVKRMRRGVKQAALCYRVLRKDVPTPWGRASLLGVTLETGRSHQIRVQFSSRGMPLIGDGKYGGSDNGVDIALWSCQLAFVHPVTGENVDVWLPPPRKAPWDVWESEDFVEWTKH